MNKGTIIVSILVATIISIILAFSIFGILYFHWGDTEAVKNSLSTVSSFFGGFATLGTAIIAAYLFNDWRDQKKYDMISTLALDAHKDFIAAKDKFQFYLHQYVYEIPEITYQEVDDEMFRAIAKINLLSAVLVRFGYDSLEVVLKKVYKNGYCELDKSIHNHKNLKNLDAKQLATMFCKAFENDKCLLGRLLDCVEQINKNQC